MQLNKYYLEAEINGSTYGKAEGGELRRIDEPKAWPTEGGYYLSIEEQEAYEAELDTLQGFDTEAEAEEAAAELLREPQKTPCLVIVQYVHFDENTYYTQRVKYLTDALGRIIPAKPSEGGKDK